MAIADIRNANRAYEDWLRAELRGDLIESDLKRKWDKMRAGPFPFLRATYWRWAETFFDVCPEFKSAPIALSVGDIHLENYGTWRDDDGRIVWGVNDFDESAEMPYPLDIVRLAVSALLARPSRDFGSKRICTAILEGYARGLRKPAPIVLDEEHAWLRTLLVVPDGERAHFWAKMSDLAPTKESPPDRYRKAIAAAMPDPRIKIDKFCRRTAGTGSLGRPRWVGIANWRGGWVLREAKALVPSAWTRVHGRRTDKLRCLDIANGQYRAPDPWWSVTGNIVVRRLSPNSRKIEVEGNPEMLLGNRMLRAMGHELANLHLGTGKGRAAIEKDFSSRDKNWLRKAARKTARFVTGEYNDWRKV